MATSFAVQSWVLRRDLEWVHYPAESRWVIHDPLRSTFFYVDIIEATAARMLDGKISPVQIVSQLCQRFGTDHITLTWLEALASKLARSQLLLDCNGRWNDPHLKSSGWTSPIRFAAGFMSLRVPIFNPSRFSSFLAWPASILFSKPALALVLLSCLGCILVVGNSVLSERGTGRLPNDLFQPSRWWIIAFLAVTIKLLHEIGHLMACVRWKVPSREVGVLFMSFIPNPYCDTTDAWRLPSKWQRASIAAGGIYIELIIACLATTVWANHPDPFVQTLSAWVMALCSIHTLFVNGNPFLRYDGYYILSDIWGIPNLSNQAKEACWNTFVAMLGGKFRFTTASNQFINHGLLLLYGLLSCFYRWSVLIVLIWVFWIWLKPLGLGILPVVIASSIAIGVIANWLRLAERFAAQLVRPQPIRWLRVIVLFSLIAAGLWYLCSVRFSSFVRTRGYLDLASKEPVFVPVDCELLELNIATIRNQDHPLPSTSSPSTSSPSTSFSTPKILAKMRSVSLDLELLRVEHESILLDQKVELLKKTKSIISSASFELPALEERFAELSQKKSILLRENAGLEPNLEEGQTFIPVRLPRSSPLTSPLVYESPSYFCNESNSGMKLKRGTILGWTSRDSRLILQSLIPEEEVKRIRAGMPVEAILDGHSFEVLHGIVDSVSKEPIRTIPAPLQGDSTLSISRNAFGELVPESRHYLATVTLHVDVKKKSLSETQPLDFLVGSLLDVRIQIEEATLREWLWRQIRLTFRRSP